MNSSYSGLSPNSLLTWHLEQGKSFSPTIFIRINNGRDSSIGIRRYLVQIKYSVPNSQDGQLVSLTLVSYLFFWDSLPCGTRVRILLIGNRYLSWVNLVTRREENIEALQNAKVRQDLIPMTASGDKEPAALIPSNLPICDPHFHEITKTLAAWLWVHRPLDSYIF